MRRAHQLLPLERRGSLLGQPLPGNEHGSGSGWRPYSFGPSRGRRPTSPAVGRGERPGRIARPSAFALWAVVLLCATIGAPRLLRMLHGFVGKGRKWKR